MSKLVSDETLREMEGLVEYGRRPSLLELDRFIRGQGYEPSGEYQKAIFAALKELKKSKTKLEALDMIAALKPEEK